MSKSEQLKNLKGKQFKSAKTGKFTSKKANEEAPAEVYATKRTTLADDIRAVVKKVDKIKNKGQKNAVRLFAAIQEFKRDANWLVEELEQK